MQRAVAAVALAAVAAACEPPPIGSGSVLIVDADPGAPDAEWMRVVTLPPDQVVEANLLMELGAAVTAEFTVARAALDWNLHRHSGPDLDTIEVLASGTSGADTLEFVATEAGAYSYQWTNPTGGALALTVQLGFSGDVRLYGWD